MLSATSLCPQIVLQEPPYASSLLTFQREWGASAGRTALSARQPLLKSPLKNRQGAWHRRLWHHRLSRPPLPDSQYDWHPAPRNRQASRFPPNWLVISLCLSGSQRAISPLAPRELSAVHRDGRPNEASKLCQNTAIDWARKLHDLLEGRMGIGFFMGRKILGSRAPT